jgi:hypothetical protein
VRLIASSSDRQASPARMGGIGHPSGVGVLAQTVRLVSQASGSSAGSACSRASALLVEKGSSHGPRFLSKSRHGCPLRPARFGALPPGRRHDAPMDSRVARRVHRGGGAGHTHCFGERPPLGSIRLGHRLKRERRRRRRRCLHLSHPKPAPRIAHVCHDARGHPRRPERDRPPLASLAFSARVRRRASADAAVAAAAREVLVALLSQLPAPPQCVAAGVASVEADYATALADIPDGRAKTRGVEVGKAAAAAILALRAANGADTPLQDFAYPQGTAPGEYRFTPGFDFAFAPGRCRTSPTHRARLPASTASHPGSILRSHRAGPTSPRSCCETARSSAQVRPTR